MLSAQVIVTSLILLRCPAIVLGANAFVPRRPRPLALVAVSATGGAPIAPPLGSLLHQKMLSYNNVSLPSTIMMRIDKHNLCTLCGEARLRFKSEFVQKKEAVKKPLPISW